MRPPSYPRATGNTLGNMRDLAEQLDKGKSYATRKMALQRLEIIAVELQKTNSMMDYLIHSKGLRYVPVWFLPAGQPVDQLVHLAIDNGIHCFRR